jgi:hypothetical protein
VAFKDRTSREAGSCFSLQPEEKKQEGVAMHIPGDLTGSVVKGHPLSIAYDEDGLTDHAEILGKFDALPKGHIAKHSITPLAIADGFVIIGFVGDDSHVLSMHTIHITNALVRLNLPVRGDEKTLTLHRGEVLLLDFEEAGYFCTKDGENFDPPLPNGLQPKGKKTYTPVKLDHITRYSFSTEHPCEGPAEVYLYTIDAKG